MKNQILSAVAAVALFAGTVSAGDDLHKTVKKDYDGHLEALFKHFHANPELSSQEYETAKRVAAEIRAAGFEVTEGVGGTGVVAILKNGDGPMVMMRADMDGLPVPEKSGLDYASKVTTVDKVTGFTAPVMHACGHDVHITSLVGTARRMAAMKDQWSGTLMLVGQPAEERGPGASAMMKDKIWDRFGQPDYALAFHVSSGGVAGQVNVLEGSPYAGADTVDITVHGVGAHGASPHAGKDPVLIGSQIVVALQTLVSRELSPRQPGVVTVGSFHSGTKHNIISDQALLQLTVRNTNLETRKILLDGIKRIAINTARVAGVAEDKLPDVVVSPDGYPPTANNSELARKLKALWIEKMGADKVVSVPPTGMGAEDFPFFTTDPYIPSVYFSIGGTPKADFERAEAGGAPVPSHHSPIFKITPEPAVISGIEATVIALLDMMKK